MTGRYKEVDEKPKPNWSGRYFVSVSDPHREFKADKLFKNKSQALRFARAYMRSH